MKIIKIKDNQPVPGQFSNFTRAAEGLGISCWTLKKRMAEYPEQFYRILE